MDSLNSVVLQAVNEWLAANGGGFPTAYVLALDYVNSEGETRLFVSEMENQPSRHSLGLIAELEELYRLEAREGWALSRGHDCSEHEDD